MPRIALKDPPLIIDVTSPNAVKKRARGRPQKSPDGFRYVVRCAAIGMTDQQIKQKLNIADRTWQRWLSDVTDGEENRELLARTRANSVSAIDAALFDRALAGNVAAAKQILAQLTFNRKLGR